MKKALAALVIVCGTAFASGFDLGFSIRNGSNGTFMGQLGIYLDGWPVDFRTNLILGSPEGAILSAEVLYPIGTLLFVTPYVGAGVATGLTAYTAANELRIRFGERFYGMFSAGLQFPDRGYRPYVEVTQFVGSESFTRFTVGFLVNVRLF